MYIQSLVYLHPHKHSANANLITSYSADTNAFLGENAILGENSTDIKLHYLRSQSCSTDTADIVPNLLKTPMNNVNNRILLLLRHLVITWQT